MSARQPRPRLRDVLSDAINGVSAENGSDTPDFILADYLARCLAAFDLATRAREDWYGHRHHPGAPDTPGEGSQEKL